MFSECNCVAFLNKSTVGTGKGLGGRGVGTGVWEVIQELSVLTYEFSKSIATIKKNCCEVFSPGRLSLRSKEYYGIFRRNGDKSSHDAIITKEPLHFTVMYEGALCITVNIFVNFKSHLRYKRTT